MKKILLSRDRIVHYVDGSGRECDVGVVIPLKEEPYFRQSGTHLIWWTKMTEIGEAGEYEEEDAVVAYKQSDIELFAERLHLPEDCPNA